MHVHVLVFCLPRRLIPPVFFAIQQVAGYELYHEACPAEELETNTKTRIHSARDGRPAASVFFALRIGSKNIYDLNSVLVPLYLGSIESSTGCVDRMRFLVGR